MTDETYTPWSERVWEFRPTEHPNHDMGTVYFIRCQGWVKVGFTSESDSKIPARLRHMQTGNPFELELVMTVPGSLVDEKRFHYKLKKVRGIGEWFSDGPELQEVLARISEGQSPEEACG